MINSGIGPKGTSLLEKLGGKRACDMSPQELRSLVEREQHNRSAKRAIGRIIRAAKDMPKVKEKVTRLEQLGLAGDVVVKLRATGKSEEELIDSIRRSGLV